MIDYIQSMVTKELFFFQIQANGLDERFNQTLQNMLCKLVQENKESWDSFLDTCTFAYNTVRPKKDISFKT